MRILIVHRYFYPDSPTYAFLLYKLAKNYKGYCKHVSVLTSMPSYYGSSSLKDVPHEEYLDGIRVKRLKLLPEHGRNFFSRAINSFLFAFAVFFHLLFKGQRYDVVQVATTPPIVSAIAVTLAAKIGGIRFVYHCQDIYPDITRVGKDGEQVGVGYKFMFSLDKFIMHHAWKIVVLSGDMKRHIVSTRNLTPKKVVVINNFDFNRKSDGSEDSGEIPKMLIPVLNSDRKKIIFAGNLGYFQNLDLVFKVINNVIDEHQLTFIVVGDGVRRNELAEQYNNKNIIFTGFLPNEIIQKIYAHCHLGLAPVVMGIEKVAYPSKIISYTLSGLPVLTFSSEGSLIEKFIVENGLGDNYAFEGEEALAGKILSILSRNFDKEQIRKKSSMEFVEQVAYNKWKKVYRSAESG